MNRNTSFLLGLTLMFQPAISFAGSANDLYVECRAAVKMFANGGRADSSIEVQRAENCITYMKGYRHGLEAQLLRMVESGVIQRKGSGHFICQPESATVKDYVSTFVQFLDKNPTLKNQHEAVAIFMALENKYPCP